MKNIVSVSILNADFSNLSELCRQIEEMGCDWIHIDVMDGVFVPNLSFAFPVVEALKKQTKLPLDVHLMIQNPLPYIEGFVKSGADYITIHEESDCDTAECLKKIKDCGVGVGISIKPATPVSAIAPFYDDLDLILVMSVEPGFGGQSFHPEALEKISAIHEATMAMKKPPLISVDGGIDGTTGPLCAKAGAHVLVSGSYLIKAKNPSEAVNLLKQDSE